MTGFQSFMENPHVHAWGWGLLNFLWQGTLVAAALKVALALLRWQRPHLRYGVAAIALGLMFCLPLISFWKPHADPPPFPSSYQSLPADSYVYDIARTQAVRETPTVPAPAPQATTRQRDWRSLAAEAFETAVPWVCVFWLIGVACAGIRSLGGLLQAQRLKKRTTPAAGYAGFRLLLKRSHVHAPVQLLESARVAVPTVIGWRRPAVLLPSGASLVPEAAEALLAHELAHIRRHDYLMNLLQAAVEIVLFYHPAVWWVSLQMRMERECCCDDDAVAVCGDLLTYVRALSEAEHRRCASKLAVAVSGTPLLNRIRRLTEMRTAKSNRMIAGLIGICALALIFVTTAGSAVMAYVPVHFARAASAMQESPVAARPPAEPQVQGAAVNKSRSNLSPAPAPAPAGAVMQKLALQSTDRLISVKRPEPAPVAKQAQSFQGSQKLTGTVYSPDGGVMPGVGISLLNPITREVLGASSSNAVGRFEIELPQQAFLLQFVAPGFQPMLYKRSDLGSDPLTVVMSLGQINETVVVVTAAPAPPPAQTGSKVKPIFVGGNVWGPKLIRRVDPVYPPAARDDNVEGTVIISALIDEEGHVNNPAVLSGHRLLNDAALAAVSQWQYTPALLDGQPWPMRLNISVVFKLQN